MHARADERMADLGQVPVALIRAQERCQPMMVSHLPGLRTGGSPPAVAQDIGERMHTMSSRLDQSVLERLDREPLAWLCTLRRDGSPHQTPVWFVFHNSTLWICSAEKNRKVRNVLLDPRVSVALEGGGAPVVAEGRVTLRPCNFSPDVIERFRTKYDWDITLPNEHEGPRVLLEIPVARWLLAGVAQ